MLVERLVEHEGARLAGTASEIEGVRVVARPLPDWDVPGLKGIALAAVASAPACVVLLTPAQPVSIVIACSPAIPVDANALLEQLTERFGGRGGGKAGLAQGGGLAGTADEIASAAHTHIEARLAPRP
jgi:alanyl-tRNA synthetase